MFASKVLADSINEMDQRLLSVQMTYPRMIHSELMTHRMFSRNAASSRAIPVSKMIEQVMKRPVVPIHWGANEKGMQAHSVLSDEAAIDCQEIWLDQRDKAVAAVESLQELGLHKQIANRLLEPWMWITVIVSATNWSNFFSLRCHKDAEPHIRKIAEMTRKEITESQPKLIREGEWHTPLIGFAGDEALTTAERVKVSVGRCARVSYLTHDGQRDVAADINLHDRLMESRHFSPFEHVAVSSKRSVDPKDTGNFGRGWTQYRKMLINECV